MMLFLRDHTLAFIASIEELKSKTFSVFSFWRQVFQINDVANHGKKSSRQDKWSAGARLEQMWCVVCRDLQQNDDGCMKPSFSPFKCLEDIIDEQYEFMTEDKKGCTKRCQFHMPKPGNGSSCLFRDTRCGPKFVVPLCVMCLELESKELYAKPWLQWW